MIMISHFLGEMILMILRKNFTVLNRVAYPAREIKWSFEPDQASLRRVLMRREGQRPLLGCTILVSDVVEKPLILASAEETVARMRVHRRIPGPVEANGSAERRRKMDFLGQDPAVPAGGVPETADPADVVASKPEVMADAMD
jgi:hypothetical protein